MPSLSFAIVALVIQLLASLVIAAHLGAALVALARTSHIPLARLRAADGVIMGLGLLTAATLLKTIELRTWTQIGLFAVVLSLRIALKRLFAWERSRILAREPGLRAHRLTDSRYGRTRLDPVNLASIVSQEGWREAEPVMKEVEPVKQTGLGGSVSG